MKPLLEVFPDLVPYSLHEPETPEQFTALVLFKALGFVKSELLKFSGSCGLVPMHSWRTIFIELVPNKMEEGLGEHKVPHLITIDNPLFPKAIIKKTKKRR